MNLHGLKKKKEKITQHLNNLKDKNVSLDHMDEQKLAKATISKKIKNLKGNKKKKHAKR